MESLAPVLASAGRRGGGGKTRREPAGRQNCTTCPLQALKLAIKSRFLIPHTKKRMILGLANENYVRSKLMTWGRGEREDDGHMRKRGNI